jgi:hypothetical protein
MRSTGKTSVGCSGLEEASSTVFAVRLIRILAIRLAVGGAHDHAVAFARGGVWGDDEDIPVSIKRLHAVAAHLQRIGVIVVDPREADLLPVLTHGEAAIVEEPAAAAWVSPIRGMGWACARARSAMTSAVKSSKEAPVASRTLAMLSVVGQRGRPSPVTRFDLLNEVESRPARLARPEAESATCTLEVSMDYLIEAKKFIQRAHDAFSPDVIEQHLSMADWCLSQGDQGARRRGRTKELRASKSN